MALAEESFGADRRFWLRPMNVQRNIILTGFMGTGKTAVGRLVAQRLGMTFLDTDHEIERRAGISIPEIFSFFGEAHFRAMEKDLCQYIAAQERHVIATGGGMPMDPDNRRLLNSAGIVICLRSEAQEILKRVGNGNGRPMLQCGDSAQRVNQLLREREPVYSAFPFQLDTTHLSVEDTAQRILRITDRGAESAKSITVNLPGGGGYTVAIGPEILGLLGKMLKDRGITSSTAVVTDTNVGPLYLEPVMTSLRDAGFKPFSSVVPAGEASKSLTQLTGLYDRFLDRGLDRRGAVVALGGGVVGDLAGYAAATFMRGVAHIQCPTTLLAMIDSSVGGKTGINLSQGKNLAGAFKHPAIVVADTGTLSTLPETQIRTGMAELIKHAVIGDAELFDTLEDSHGPVHLGPDLITRSLSVKIAVVEQDPLETGQREVLNLGHTVGHALEKCSQYSFSHGDAVSVGMVAAARISHMMGLCESSVCSRLESLLARNGLPTTHRLEPNSVMTLMSADKKFIECNPRFVLIKDIGSVEYARHVAPDVVKSVVEDLKGVN
ncbi:MAG TPA: 3-dehydroquinate synthase [Desulfomonilaceae bacterium]|nr:3-dehydroquinate synthase [Desulfomonilaceae bacterium]